MEIEKDLGRKDGMVGQYDNLENTYQTKGKLYKAQEMHQKSLKINRELVRKESMAKDYINLSRLHRTKGDYAQAENYYNRSLALYEKIGAKPMIEKLRRWLAELGELKQREKDKEDGK